MSEPRTVAGEVLLSHNHIALLHGLYDRPDGVAESCADLVRAAFPYLEQMRTMPSVWCLRRSLRTLHPLWASRARKGNRIVVSLEPRGRAIVERNLPARVRGRGLYRGFAALRVTEPLAGSPEIPAGALLEAAEYARSYGIPLLSTDCKASEKPLVYACSAGLDQPFTLVSRDEVDMHGPRWWHFQWTRWHVDSESLPSGYAEAFRNYEGEDVLNYLRESRKAGVEGDVYALAYYGEKFLSKAKLKSWLDEGIDLSTLDVQPHELRFWIRHMSSTHRRVLAALGGAPRLTWRHPRSGRSIGSVFRERSDGRARPTLIATSPAALSAFAMHCEAINAGIRIDVRYVT